VTPCHIKPHAASFSGDADAMLLDEKELAAITIERKPGHVAVYRPQFPATRFWWVPDHLIKTGQYQ